jgi:hypothetical protein
MTAFTQTAAPPAAAPSGKKLTWSERQAESKRQREEEEMQSKAAIRAGE